MLLLCLALPYEKHLTVSQLRKELFYSRRTREKKKQKNKLCICALQPPNALVSEHFLMSRIFLIEYWLAVEAATFSLQFF